LYRSRGKKFFGSLLGRTNWWGLGRRFAGNNRVMQGTTGSNMVLTYCLYGIVGVKVVAKIDIGRELTYSGSMPRPI